jgi:sugar-specific transcriptional regulator TrmB
MTQNSQKRATELLQQLGLKEYEARCFVALTRMPKGTAKDISEVSDVPRTRVYDAIRVLEAKGLVEVQHSSPRQYRPVSVDEATDVLVAEYESRIDTVNDALASLDPADADPADSPPTGEVWTLTSDDSIAARTTQLVEDAADEVVLIVGDDGALGERIYPKLQAATERGVGVYVGIVDPDLGDAIHEAAPDIEVFASNLDWLSTLPDEEEVDITRVLLADHETILVGARSNESGPEEAEQAVFGSGFTNGIVVILRRLLRRGLLEGSDLDDANPPETAPEADPADDA